MSKQLTNEDYVRAANSLGVDIPSIKAVLDVEAPRGGFQDDGQVSILFEPHKFSAYTNGRYDDSHPDLSYPVWGTRPYGKYSEQHAKLQRAVALDRDAALRATSWGFPQILGNNWKAAGAISLQDFINRMSRSAGAQLDLMVNFIKSNAEMRRALKNHDWATFAKNYNGTAYAKNQYDIKLAKAYRKFAV
jgi:Protein of unknown function (DUF3380).